MKRCVGPKNCLRILFRQYIPAQKAPVTWPHPIEPRRGRVGKTRRARRPKLAKIEWQEASTPFCKSLRVHENRHAKTVSQSEASI